jgi:hypothetical protein
MDISQEINQIILLHTCLGISIMVNSFDNGNKSHYFCNRHLRLNK